MNRSWVQKPLPEVISLKRGYDLPTQRRRKGSIPVVGSFGITGSHDVAKERGPGVTIGRSGASMGTTTYVERDYWPLNTALFVTDFKDNDPEWVFWALKATDFSSYNSGSAQPSLNRNLLGTIQLVVPPLPVQRRIAAVLGALDDLIETNERLVDSVWDLMKHAYEKYATDAARVPMSEVLDLKYGKSLPSKSREPGPYPVVGSGGVVGSHSHALVCGPGIVVGRKGSIGRLTWVDVDYFPIDTTFFVETELPSVYAYFMLSQLPLAQMNTDSAVPGLNRANALAQLVAVPGPAELDRFQRLTEPLIELRSALTGEVDSLRTARDELLPLLLSGRVSPGEVDLGV